MTSACTMSAASIGARPVRCSPGTGFQVLRASYWNTLLFPLMLVHRLVEKQDAESDVRDYPAWLDALFSAALAIERAAINAGLSLPFGGSLIVVARRD